MTNPEVTRLLAEVRADMDGPGIPPSLQRTARRLADAIAILVEQVRPIAPFAGDSPPHVPPGLKCDPEPAPAAEGKAIPYYAITAHDDKLFYTLWDKGGWVMRKHVDDLLAQLAAAREEAERRSNHAETLQDLRRMDAKLIIDGDAERAALSADNARLREALTKLEDAASAYCASQAGATDPRCGVVQPITVVDGNALNEALTLAAESLVPPAPPTPATPPSAEAERRGGQVIHTLRHDPERGAIDAMYEKMNTPPGADAKSPLEAAQALAREIIEQSRLFGVDSPIYRLIVSFGEAAFRADRAARSGTGEPVESAEEFVDRYWNAPYGKSWRGTQKRTDAAMVAARDAQWKKIGVTQAEPLRSDECIYKGTVRKIVDAQIINGERRLMFASPASDGTLFLNCTFGAPQ